MATERIEIIVSERGSRVVRRNLADIGTSARETAGGVQFLTGALKTLVVALGIDKIIQNIDAYTQLQNRLRSTGLEGRNLVGVYQALLQVANDTRSSVEGSVELYARLALSSKELGVSQQQLIDFTKSLNQAIILSGASAAEAQAGLIQLSQGMASGTLRGDELRSVLEQLPAVADVIAKHLGVTRGQLRQMGQDGKITAHDIIDAFKEAKDELEERFGKTVPTISQSFQVLKNHVVDMFGRMNEATGISAVLSKGLLLLANNIDTVVKALISLAAGWVIISGGAAAFQAVRTAILALNAAIAANPIGFLLTALTSVLTALTLFRDQIKLGTNDVTSLGDLMRAVGEKISAVFQKIWTAAKAAFGPLIKLIEDWIGKVDFSIAGVLKLVAKGVDLYVGAWLGGIGAVITLFRNFGPAAGDLLTQALNYLLGKIGDFANGALELLSHVPGFGDAAKVKLNFKLDNDNAGAASRLGKDIGDAMRNGLANSSVQDFVQGLLDRADEIGKKRVADAAKGGTVGTTAGKPTNVPTGDDKALKKLAEALKNLIGQYDGVYAAQQQVKEAEKLLTEGVKAHLITEEKKVEVMKLVKEQLRDQLDPIGAVNRELDKQRELLALTADAREVESQRRAIELDLMRQGQHMSEAENNQLREKLTLIQAETKAAQARDAVYRAIKGPQEDALNDLAAIQKLIKDGQITQDEANAYFVGQHADLMAGTVEARQADLFNLQQYYQQVDQWRQADLISAQTAAKLKADAETTYNLKRLEGAQAFFGTLAGLSRSENRKLAAIGKAAAVAQATIDGYAAVQKALIGPPGPPWSYAIAAATAAVTGANVASIINTPLPGFAFGGAMKVAGVGGTDSQTVAFRATPGETVRVSTPAQDREEARRNGSGGGQTPVQIAIVDNPERMLSLLRGPHGDTIFIDLAARNPEIIQRLAQPA